MVPLGLASLCGGAGDFTGGQMAGPLGTSVFRCASVWACACMLPLIKRASTTTLTNIMHIRSHLKDQPRPRVVVPKATAKKRLVALANAALAASELATRQLHAFDA